MYEISSVTPPHFNTPWVTIISGLIFVLSTAFFIFLAWKLFLYIVRSMDREETFLDVVMFEIRLPKDNEFEISVAEQMFASLYSIYRGGWYNKVARKQEFVSFEVVGLPETIRFYVVCPRKISTMVEKLIHGSYPTADVIPVKEYNIFHENGFVEFAEVQLAKENYYPIRVYEEIKTDGISPLTSALSKMQEGEGAVFQLVISPVGNNWAKGGKSFVSNIEKARTSEEGPKVSVPQHIIDGVNKKCSKVGFSTAIRIVASSYDKNRAKMHLNNILSTLGQYNAPQMNYFKKKKLMFWERRAFIENFLYRKPRLFGNESVLNTEELATIFHFPNKNVQTPNINWVVAKTSPATEEVPTEGIWLGKAVFRGIERDVYIKEDDRRRHMYIIGQTGTGKSFLLQMLALQDIQQGHGVAFLDPHGDAAEWLLERIPPERAEDVIYWYAGDAERPFGFNIIEYHDDSEKHMIISSFYAMIEKMYDPNKVGITGPILERAIRNCMLTAMSKEGSTLIEVGRLLLFERDFVEEMKKYIKDDLVMRYWTEEVAKTTSFHQSERIGYFAAKLDRFITDNIMRGMIGQSKTTFDIRKIMDEGKIFIVNLSKAPPLGEENSQFLGLLLVPKFLSAAMGRAKLPPEQRRDFYLYVDEFQNFSTDKFATILSEARKYRLNLCVANQYIGQMIQPIRDAVFGNVGTLICFRVGPDDAEYLSTHFDPVFSKSDLANIDNQNAYVKLLVNGKYPPPFSMCTTYKAPEGNKELAATIKELSRMRYGRDRREVDAEIKKRGEITYKSSPMAATPMPSLGGW